MNQHHKEEQQLGVETDLDSGKNKNESANILDVLPYEMMEEILSYLKLHYIKRLSCVSKVFFDLTEPYFRKNSLLNIKKEAPVVNHLCRKYTRITVGCFLTKSSLENLVYSNAECLKILDLKLYSFGTSNFVIPAKCQLVEFSIRFCQDLRFLEDEEYEVCQIEKDFIRMLEHQKNLAKLDIRRMHLSQISFEKVRVSEKLTLETCELKIRFKVTNPWLENLQHACISKCSFKKTSYLNAFLKAICNVKSLEISMITVEDYYENSGRGKCVLLYPKKKFCTLKI